MSSVLTSIEICAGAGGQALGLEQAGFEHQLVVDNDKHCCATLRLNRPLWNVSEFDLSAPTHPINWEHYRDREIDLLAGGLPCPPFSVAGKQLGERDERNLFPAALDLIDIVRPKAVMIENVRGLLGGVFEDYRAHLERRLKKLGYASQWLPLQSSDFGVPQLRPRTLLVAILGELSDQLDLDMAKVKPKTVGETLLELMAENGWRGAHKWRERADDIAPTIVGGSKKHGGPDLGPTRAKKAWAALGVDGMGIADQAPPADFIGMPRLTVPMVARLQGFPDDWSFAGRKTAAYRQVGNAFPPPVAKAVGEKIAEALTGYRRIRAVA